MLQKERIIARDYRNRRIGDFLKELQLTEGCSTGFAKIYKAMEQNGSPEPDFETDSYRSYFWAKLPIHSTLKEGTQALDLILLITWRSGYFKRTLQSLLENELIEYTHPDTPRHPDQKYKITDVGKRQIE